LDNCPRTTSTTIGGSKIQANPSAKNKDMVIYPNPAADYFNISLPTGQYEMTLTDVLGRTIKQTQLNEFATINTEGMQAGVYQITIRKQGEKAIFQTEKVIIK
jgi:hypothetical protein